MTYALARTYRSAAERTLLVLAAVSAAVALLLDVLAGFAFTHEEFVPGPPGWPMVVLFLAVGLVGPVAAVLQWRTARRGNLAPDEVVASTALIGGLVAVGGLIVLFFLWAFALASA